MHVAMVGDLKYGRTVHSLAQALSLFNVRLYFVSHPILEMPKRICDELKEKGIKFSFHKSVEEVIDKTDVLYMTRVQEERFAHKLEYEQVKNAFLLKAEQLEKAKNNLKHLCIPCHELMNWTEQLMRRRMPIIFSRPTMDYAPGKPYWR